MFLFDIPPNEWYNVVGGGLVDFKIKETRAEYSITQREMSEILEIPLRTIENWESGKRKPSKWVEKLIIDNLSHYKKNEHGIITKEKGQYSINQIRDLLLPLTFKYEVDKFILFGSYSKNKQDSRSDIDLIVEGNIRGLTFIGLLEDVNNLFVKDVDLLRLSQVNKASDMYEDIMKGVILFERKR